MWHRPDNKTTETRSANAQKSSLILPFPQNQSIQAITMLYFYVKRPLILQDTGPH